MIRNLRQKSQHLLERGLVHGTLVRLCLLFVGSFIFILMGTGAYFVGLFDDENKAVENIGTDYGGGFIDAFWWSLKHAIDPGTFTGDYGSSFVIVVYALIITLGGWAIFGVFVGVISASIEKRLAQLDKGIGRVVVSDHVLILGWNTRAPAVIARLFENKANPTIVVLAPQDVPTIRNELRLSEQLDSKKAHKVTFRQGVVTSEQELKGVSFEHAERIIILANDDPNQDEISNDMVSIELISLFAHTKTWVNGKPHIVAEILDDSTREIANLAGDHQIPVFTSTDTVSRIIVQASRQPDLSKVYLELFSGGQSQLMMQHVPDCTGMAFIDILNKFPEATPIGVCDVLDLEDRLVHIPDINPPADHIIEEQEKIILISNSKSIRFDKDQEAFTPLDAMAESGKASTPFERILILGWNQGIYKILDQYATYLPKEDGHIKVVSSYDVEKAQNLLKHKAKRAVDTAEVKLEQANYLDRDTMKALLKEDYDRVILLSDQSKGIKDRDSIIKMSLILLQWAFETQNLAKTPHVIAEVIENTGMLARPPYSQFELISSPEVASRMLTHFAQENDLRTIATELLNPLGQEVNLRPAVDYVELDTAFKFGQLVRSAKEKDQIIWGIIRAENKKIILNPDSNIEMTLSDGDQVIILSH
ncbi:hypothetical protein RYZ26_12205 [Terasakiella sp. A23]|uniref:CASTOR/POLLUX-related putative ion channel n=1 Tax=Terasakiella sp. FCG-A23 TaxID=3080561 RepID=UPI0029530EBC|nr:hypothetical protein [Terasakiella sp. A23]MDV7340358.1 hypothetical protein [Terasakiella sp. A23]